MLPETWPEPGEHANMFTVVGRQSGSVSLSVPDAATISSVVLYRLGHMSLKLLENRFSSIHQQIWLFLAFFITVFSPGHMTRKM